MSLSEQKLANALAFLSLDLATEFGKELEIPMLGEINFRSDLRHILGNYIDGNRYFNEYPDSTYRVFNRIVNREGIEMWRTIRTWVDSVFINGGQDRHAESVWTLIISRGCSERTEINKCLLEKIGQIQLKLASARSETSARISSIKGKQMSQWDIKMLPLIYADIDNVCDKVLLIHTYNRLIAEWKSMSLLSIDDLVSIHQWGKRIAAGLGIREIDVTFPGAWQY